MRNHEHRGFTNRHMVNLTSSGSKTIARRLRQSSGTRHHRRENRGRPPSELWNSLQRLRRIWVETRSARH